MQVSTVVVDGDGKPTDTFSAFLDSVQGKLRWTGSVIYGTSAQRTTSTTRGYNPPQNIADGSLYVETDTGLVYQLRSTVAGDNSGNAKVRSAAWACILGTQIVAQVLTVAGPTNINAPTTGALRLIHVFDQDGTGGRAIHWNTGFSYSSDSLGAMVASSRSIFEHVLDPVTGLYMQVGQQTVDML